MNRKNLELFGLSEGATKEELTAAYDKLRAKYLEERFMDGEVGNNAAEMLTRIDNAYSDLIREFSENSSAESEGASFTRVEELINQKNYADAQRELDSFNERGARWHFLQSTLFFRKGWINESKKQLEIAMQLDPENQKYKEVYKKLNEKIEYDSRHSSYESVYRAQGVDSVDEGQMGGSGCEMCMRCCLIEMCCYTCCNCCR